MTPIQELTFTLQVFSYTLLAAGFIGFLICASYLVFGRGHVRAWFGDFDSRSTGRILRRRFERRCAIALGCVVAVSPFKVLLSYFAPGLLWLVIGVLVSMAAFAGWRAYLVLNINEVR